ncbi:zinc transporter, ZIP family [Alkalibacterium subtropicum]|uniref:Zinc transporter, ZIP family n=1 Tax=Alkalibacterium subtropicum TaxID=753702 RepID=A0A1I1EN20_9LACT|nr:ZIP family metal transporter [Alkalibacterium subtropicum]SFB88495.1 zinc transporter, ZIP family [Alkalibacterium subtropicum]
MDWFITLHPVLQALLATIFTWAVTALGASLVFLKKDMNKNTLTAMLGFAAGVMIAASFWSLLAPAIELAEATDVPGWIPAVVGFLAGGVFLFITDKLLPHLHPSLNGDNGKKEGIETDLRRSVLLVLAITLHNIPEGLAVGVAFGAAAAGFPASTVASAIALAVGIGLQNFPEGASVSLPLRREGFSRFKAFAYGQASGIVEPFAGVMGAALVLSMRPLLPYALSFAAGAMIYVVVEELIPEAKVERHNDIGTIGAMIGFTVMMFLDVALG